MDMRLGDEVEVKARRVKVEVQKVNSEGKMRRDAKSVSGARGRRPEPVSDGDKQEKRKRSLGCKRRVMGAESRPRGILASGVARSMVRAARERHIALTDASSRNQLDRLITLHWGQTPLYLGGKFRVF